MSPVRGAYGSRGDHRRRGPSGRALGEGPPSGCLLVGGLTRHQRQGRYPLGRRIILGRAEPDCGWRWLARRLSGWGTALPGEGGGDAADAVWARGQVVINALPPPCVGGTGSCRQASTGRARMGRCAAFPGGGWGGAVGWAAGGP